MSADPAADRADLESLQNGDEKALARLVARWAGPLAGYARRYGLDGAEAGEVAAEALAKLYFNRNRLRPDTRLGAWLYSVLKNSCRNRLRWRWRRPVVSLEQAASVAASEAGPAGRAQEAELAAALQKAVAALPHRLRTVLLLQQYGELSHREIAAVMGCSEKSVEARLYRARQRLREELREFIR